MRTRCLFAPNGSPPSRFLLLLFSGLALIAPDATGSHSSHLTPQHGEPGSDFQIVDPEKRFDTGAEAVFTNTLDEETLISLEIQSSRTLARGSLPDRFEGGLYSVSVRVPGEEDFAVGDFVVDTETIDVPSNKYSTLRKAIRNAQSGATIHIAQGVYQLSQPLQIEGKYLNILGAGSDATLLEWSGEDPSEALEDAADAAAFDLTAGGQATIHGLSMTGFSAGVVALPDQEEPWLELHEVEILASSRGLLWQAGGHLHATDVLIEGSSNEGVLLKLGDADSSLNFWFTASQIVDSGSAGFRIFDSTEGCDEDINRLSDVSITNSGASGIDAVHSEICVYDSVITSSVTAGFFATASRGEVANTLISDSAPDAEGLFGDGAIALADATTQSDVRLIKNRILNSARGAISTFGSRLFLEENLLACQAFDIEAEPWEGFDWVIEVSGSFGAKCAGCPVPAVIDEDCLLVSACFPSCS